MKQTKKSWQLAVGGILTANCQLPTFLRLFHYFRLFRILFNSLRTILTFLILTDFVVTAPEILPNGTPLVVL